MLLDEVLEGRMQQIWDRAGENGARVALGQLEDSGAFVDVDASDHSNIKIKVRVGPLAIEFETGKMDRDDAPVFSDVVDVRLEKDWAG